MSQKYLEAIKNPIPKEENTILESEGFIFLEEEMTKFSSMRENTLDWEKAEQTAVELLSKYTKNLRVLAHLLLCLQHDRDAERFILSIQILNGFIESFWKTSKPKIQPLKKELVFKKKLLRQMLIRTEQATSKLDLTEGDRALLPQFTTTLESLKAVVATTGLEYDDFWKMSAEYKKKLPAEAVVQKQYVKSGSSGSTDKPTQLKTENAHSTASIETPDLNFSTENERETKQTFFKVASFLNSTFEKEPLGYRFRRFALWFNISSLPPLKKDGNTEIMAVLSDRMEEYTAAISNQCELDVLKNIEQTVSTSPFWITGSYLSSRAAESLGMDDVSFAIQEETLRFTKRIPALLDTKFSDGTPFVDNNTKRWLAQAGNSAVGEGGEWQSKLEDAIQAAKQGRFKTGLNIIEKGINSAKQPRDKFYWRLAHADFLEKTGMSTLAREVYNSLNSEIAQFDVSVWEPLLVDELHDKAKPRKQNKIIDKVKGLKQ